MRLALLTLIPLALVAATEKHHHPPRSSESNLGSVRGNNQRSDVGKEPPSERHYRPQAEFRGSSASRSRPRDRNKEPLSSRAAGGNGNGNGNNGNNGSGGGTNSCGAGNGNANEMACQKARKFKEDTQLPQRGYERKEEHEFSDSKGKKFKAKNVKVQTKQHRIKLKGAKTEIASITCIPAGGTEDLAEVIVTLTNAIEPSMIDELFPLASTLMVESDDFGHCDLGGLSPLDDIDDIEIEEDDAFLIVDHATTEDGQTISVFGHPSDWFGMFDIFQYEMDAVEEHVREDPETPSWAMNHNRALSKEDLDAMPEDVLERRKDEEARRRLGYSSDQIKSANQEAMKDLAASENTEEPMVDCGTDPLFDLDFQLGHIPAICAEVTVGTCMNLFDTGFYRFKIDTQYKSCSFCDGTWDDWECLTSVAYWVPEVMVVEIGVIQAFKAEAALGFGFYNCIKETRQVVPILKNKILIAALQLDPALTAAINAVDSIGGHELPGFAIGLYAGLNYVIDGKVVINNLPRMELGVGYDMGREKKLFTLTCYPYSGSCWDKEEILEYEPGKGAYTFIEPRDGSGFAVDFDLFVGLQPTIGMYSRIIYLETGVEFGLMGSINLRGPNATPLPAISCGGACNSLCSQSHHVRMGLDFEVRDWYFTANLYISFWDLVDFNKDWTWMIVAGAFVDIDIGDLCFFPPGSAVGSIGLEPQPAPSCPAWDAGWGPCSTYAPGGYNRWWCPYDFDFCHGTYANQGCAECSYRRDLEGIEANNVTAMSEMMSRPRVRVPPPPSVLDIEIDVTTFDAGHGGCDTYAPGEENFPYCGLDFDPNLKVYASEACADECYGHKKRSRRSLHMTEENGVVTSRGSGMEARGGWGDGTTCVPHISCHCCANSYEWWDGPFCHKCGKEPCWGGGTVCGAGTTCGNCCSGQNCPWYQFGVCTCK